MKEHPFLDRSDADAEGASAEGLNNIQDLIDAVRTSDSPRIIESDRRVFCNRTLAMSGVDAIGFDMDYTLALYHQEAIDRLSHEKTLERLVSHRGYPESVLSIAPRPNFAIRGLVIDKQKGNIFKMDSHTSVGKVYRGFAPSEEAKAEYRQKPIRIDDRFHLVDTLFALPEAFLFAALTDHFENVLNKEIEPHRLFDDIRYCIDLAHRDNSMKSAMIENLAHYVVRDPLLGPTLHRFRSSGKRLFLMTNSYCEYTTHVMSYLLDGVLPEYPSWKNYFDVIITAAKKPTFFTERTPFVRLDENGEPAGEEHTKLERGTIYQHGNFVDFERMFGSTGPGILYVGDHIYGDILRSRRTSAWRTCMIVQEMQDELRKTDTVRAEIGERNELEFELNRINDEIHYIGMLSRRFDDWVAENPHAKLPGDEAENGEGTNGENGRDGERTTLERAQKETLFRLDRLKRRRKRLMLQISDLVREIESNFNKYWGLVFKEGNELSIFGKQVQDYACLYTSRVSNLLGYSPLHTYRSPVELLPHEI